VSDVRERGLVVRATRDAEDRAGEGGSVNEEIQVALEEHLGLERELATSVRKNILMFLRSGGSGFTYRIFETEEYPPEMITFEIPLERGDESEKASLHINIGRTVNCTSRQMNADLLGQLEDSTYSVHRTARIEILEMSTNRQRIRFLRETRGGNVNIFIRPVERSEFTSKLLQFLQFLFNLFTFGVNLLQDIF
jgi:hypothetical protein